MTAILPDTEDPETKPFWDAARASRLVVQQCTSCRRLRFPPMPGCPKCHSTKAGWKDVSGRATLWSYNVVHGPMLPAFQDVVPFPVAIVSLAEASYLRMLGNLVGAPGAAINSVDPATLKIGMPLKVSFRQVEDVTLPCWVPE
jgi:uncharacterized OB-fold protein